MRRWIEARVDSWRRTGASLDEPGLKLLRGARWWAPASGALFLLAALLDERWWASALFGALACSALVVVWPASHVMLRAHRLREHIDTRGAERFDAVGIGAGAAAGAALVPLVKWLEQSWPW